jgi:hypothetical protein
MTATTVAHNNLYSESWNNIYSLINNKSLVADPSCPSTQSRKWVYARLPDVKDIAFSDFPFIVVHPAEINFGDSQTANRRIQSTNFIIEVEVVTCDRAFGNRDGCGAIDIDNISNDIVETFNSTSARNTLKSNGLAFFKPNGGSAIVEDFNNTLIYRRSFMIGFGGKKKVY